MNSCGKLNDDTKRYLCRFYEILDEMIKGMNCAELTNSISHNFIVQMIPHHKAAIEMSENLLKYSNFEPLKRIAENIIEEQTKSIVDMQKAMSECKCVLNTQQDLCLYENKLSGIKQEMFSEMRNTCSDNNINADFMREMIPHHKGAIKMSKNALKYCICPELCSILKAIIESQERGVSEMEGLLRGFGC